MGGDAGVDGFDLGVEERGDEGADGNFLAERIVGVEGGEDVAGGWVEPTGKRGSRDDRGRRRGMCNHSFCRTCVPNFRVSNLLFQVRYQNAERDAEHRREAFVVVESRRAPFLRQHVTHRALGHAQAPGKLTL